MPDHNTGNFMPYSLRLVCGFFNVPQLFKVVRRDLRLIVLIRENLKVWCNYKGSTFSSVILRPWVLVRSESNSWPPTSQPDAHQLSHQCAVKTHLLSCKLLWKIFQLSSSITHWWLYRDIAVEEKWGCLFSQLGDHFHKTTLCNTGYFSQYKHVRV